MEGNAAIAGVGVGLSQVQFQAEYQARVLRTQQEVMKDVSNAALHLIKTAVLSTDGSVGRNLDVLA